MGVTHAQKVEQALDPPVFAIHAMQGVEHDFRPVGRRRVKQRQQLRHRRCGVSLAHIEAGFAQGFRAGRAAVEGNLAFRRIPTH